MGPFGLLELCSEIGGRRLKKIGKRAKAAYILVIVFCLGLGFFYVTWGMNGGSWSLSPYNKHIYSNGSLQNTGVILDRDGEVLAETIDNKRQYNENLTVRRSLLHLIGDNTSFLGGSIQQSYAAALAGYSPINGVHMLSEWNMVPEMTLTVSAALNKTVAEAFGSSRKGAVIAYNYRTGEIVCMLSAPNYDPENKPEKLEGDRYEGVYVNRALNGMYPPGSTFKIVTATAAIDNIPDIMSRKFTCTGKLETADGGEIICNSKHGELDFKRGFAVSCNVVFAQLAMELGSETMKSTAEKYGFNKNGSIGNIGYSGGLYNTTGASVTDLGWSGIGQYTNLASPYTMMMLSGTIAMGGNSTPAKVIGTIKNSFGIPTNFGLSLGKNVISSGTAETLKGMMKSAAEYTFGTSTVNQYSLRCKTGTAEVDDGQPHAWLTGFLEDAAAPYAFAIVLENAGSAASATRSVALALIKGLQDIK